MLLQGGRVCELEQIIEDHSLLEWTGGRWLEATVTWLDTDALEDRDVDGTSVVQQQGHQLERLVEEWLRLMRARAPAASNDEGDDTIDRLLADLGPMPPRNSAPGSCALWLAALLNPPALGLAG